MEARKLDTEYYTYRDLLRMGEDVRVELIDGVIYNMASPSWKHQSVAGRIYSQLDAFLRGKNCRTFIAPFDVRLNAKLFGNEDNTVVQPDVIVICDRSKLDSNGNGYRGAPDLVVEVLSPSTAYNDRHKKLIKYQDAGVREYWIVDPKNMTVEVYVPENGAFKLLDVYGVESECECPNPTDCGCSITKCKMPVQILEHCEIDLDLVFEDLDN